MGSIIQIAMLTSSFSFRTKFAPDNWYMFRNSDLNSSALSFFWMVDIFSISVSCALFTFISGIFMTNSYSTLLFSDCCINIEYSNAALRLRKYATQTIERTLRKKKMTKMDWFKNKSIRLKTIRLRTLIISDKPFQVKNDCTFDRSDKRCKVSVFSLVSK